MKKFVILMLCTVIILSAIPVFNAQEPVAWTDIGDGRARLDYIEVKDGVALADTESGGLTVVEIGEEACAYADAQSIVFPSRLETIGCSAFVGNDALEGVDLPLSVTYIGDYAFSECDLSEIYLSENISFIGSNALGSTATVYVIEDSYAHNYCVENGLEYVLADENCSHDVTEEVITVYPTCIDAGESARQCMECGKLFDRTAVNSLGHSYSTWKLSEDGRIRSCGRCLNSYSDFVAGKETTPFNDLNDGAWYVDSVAFCYSNSIINGMTPSVFSPDIYTTRAMVVRILAGYAGVDTTEYTEAPFTDVPKGSWFTPAIAWASEAGIVKGYGETFGPDDNVTREQLALIMKQFSDHMGYTYETVGADISGFSDAGLISVWAEKGMEWAIEQGIVNGMGNGTLAPQGNATRAQVARMITLLADRFEPADDAMYDRVVVFCIDGAGDYFKNARTPHIDSIFDVTATAEAEVPTGCTENWASILYGVPAEAHKLNGINIVRNTGSFTTFLGLAAMAYPDDLVASFTADHKISKYIVESDLGIYTTDQENVYDNTLADILAAEGGYLETNDPKLLFVEMRQSEQGAIHFEGGYDGERYHQQLALTDGYIGQIYDKYEALGRTDKTLFLLITDHGGIAGTTSSGGSSADEVNIVFAAGGYTVDPQAELEGISNRDIFAIVAEALNIDVPYVCDSVCPEDLFIKE